jgi:cytoskeletal protein RodZ
MKQKEFDLRGASRSDQRAKRRKTNLILNSLIVIVILLIVIVSYSIFFGNGEKASPTAADASGQAQENQEGNSEVDDSAESSTNEENEGSEGNSSVTEENPDDTEDTGSDENETDTTVEEPESENIVSEGGTDPNVKNTITNPDWQPVGTTQSGEHVPVYDKSAVDWKEMEKAISYGTGLNQSEMTLWFLGRNKEGAENQSVATVSTKDNSVTYRVYIEWVDGQGWKPIKVEELFENDRR